VADLSLQTAQEGTAAVVRLRGELDLSGATTLDQELEQLEQGPATTIVLDLRDLTFMDSSGLRVIAMASQRGEADGRRVALVPGPEQVMRVFDVTRMRERLDFVADPREATGGG
jgi:anti-anti-sigma factor